MFPIVSRIKAWWESADRNQRVVTLGGVGALLLLLVGTTFLATRPHYETAIEGLSDLELAKDRDALVAAGINAQAGDNGSLLVPVGQTKEATMKLATAGLLPKGKGKVNLVDLSSLGPFKSPEEQAQAIKLIQESQIAGALETMDGVAAANVLITQPQSSVFAQDKRHPTASVTITERGQGELTAANGRIIANLVCSAVDGMTLEDVFVSNSSLGVLWDGHAGESTGSKAELDAKVARDWEAKVQAALSAYGMENVKVAVRADVDTDKRHSVTRGETPTGPVRVESKTENVQGGATQRPGGVPGSTTNMPNPSAPAAPANGTAGGSGAYDGKDKSVTYGVNVNELDVVSGVGSLKGLAISVTANSDKISDIAPVQKIVDGLMGGLVQRDATGAAMPNQAFSAVVASVKFDTSADLAAKAAVDAAAGRQRTQQVLSLLPIGAILLVALLIAKQVGKIAKAALPSPAPVEAALPGSSADALPGAGLAFSEEGPDALPMHAGVAGEAESPFVLERIKDRVDPSLEGLKQMAAERPDMVATLIKSMMLGERA